MTNDPARPSKKTEMIEVRVSQETKHDFLAACHRAERTASDVVRAAIDSFIEGQASSAQAPAATVMEMPAPAQRRRYLAAGALVAGLTMLAALPSAAQPDMAAAFKRLDANSDGALTVEEFSASASDVKRMNLRKVERGATSQTPPDPSKASIFILTPGGEDVSAEWRDVRVQMFSSDGAPMLSSEERRKRDFTNFDRNADGRVDLDEYQARNRVMLKNGFSRLDKDSDGAVTSEEYAMLGSPVLMTPPDAIMELGVASKYGPVVSAKDADVTFGKLDTNNDGKLALQEYLSRP